MVWVLIRSALLLYILEESNFNDNFKYVRLFDLDKKAKLFANSGDPDQRPHSVASNMGLLDVCQLPFWSLSRPKWVK